jgi:predicted TIM-barrel fold metal-dependent hydrolase
MLGFDAEERMIQRLPQNFAPKIIWGSRYPQHDTTSGWDAIDKLARAKIDDVMLARMLGGNATAQFGIELMRNGGSH